MTPNPPRVVFNCNVYLQAMISPNGPAARCLELARQGAMKVVVSDYVLAEIRDLPNDHKVAAKFQLTVEKAERFVVALVRFAEHLGMPPDNYQHPFDPDDSHYVNLAIASNANPIVSRDRHLLNLMDPARPEGRDFLALYPAIRIMDPVAFLRWINHEIAGTSPRPN